MAVLSLAWSLLIGRLDGPFFLRCLIEPTVAIILAVRAGRADARAHREPYLWHVLAAPDERRQLLRDGWGDIGHVYLTAFLIDAAYQAIEFHWVYVLQAALVAALLAIVPYLLVRGPVTRLSRRYARA